MSVVFKSNEIPDAVAHAALPCVCGNAEVMVHHEYVPSVHDFRLTCHCPQCGAKGPETGPGDTRLLTEWTALAVVAWNNMGVSA